MDKSTIKPKNMAYFFNTNEYMENGVIRKEGVNGNFFESMNILIEKINSNEVQFYLKN